jgi:hypothetical protein
VHATWLCLYLLVLEYAAAEAEPTSRNCEHVYVNLLQWQVHHMALSGVLAGVSI